MSTILILNIYFFFSVHLHYKNNYTSLSTLEPVRQLVTLIIILNIKLDERDCTEYNLYAIKPVTLFDTTSILP